jgi:hypothetical protein
MAQYSIVVNGKGTILSVKSINIDPKKMPVKRLTGRHFSHLIGADCRKDLRNIMHETTKSRQPGNFRTFFAARGHSEGAVVEWTIQARYRNLINMVMPRYVLVGSVISA